MKTSLVPMVIVSLLVGVLSGCSIFNKSKGGFDLVPRRITIQTEPEGASVIQLRPLGMSSTELGNTPINNSTVSVMTNVNYKNMPFSETQELMKHANNVVVKISKEGFEPYVTTLQTSPFETSVLKVKPVAIGK
jgi:hypothetical protein